MPRMSKERRAEVIDADDGLCGCGQKSLGSASFRTCEGCKRPLCHDCAECSDLDKTGDYCAPCFEARP